MYAAMKNSADAVTALLDNGASRDLADKAAELCAVDCVVDTVHWRLLYVTAAVSGRVRTRMLVMRPY